MEASLQQRPLERAEPLASGAGDFAALEEKIQRAVAVLRQERTAREAAEAEALATRTELESLRLELAATQAELSAAHTQIGTLSSERDAVRLRVEKVLRHMDELIS